MFQWSLIEFGLKQKIVLANNFTTKSVFSDFNVFIRLAPVFWKMQNFVEKLHKFSFWRAKICFYLVINLELQNLFNLFLVIFLCICFFENILWVAIKYFIKQYRNTTTIVKKTIYWHNFVFLYFWNFIVLIQKKINI